MASVWTQDKEDLLRELWERDDIGKEAICKELRIGLRTLRNHAERLRLPERDRTIAFRKDAWPDERIAELKKLWAEGHTAAEIGRRMSGLSRNAILGKAYRVGLSRQAPDKPAKPAPQRKHAKSNSYNHMAARNLAEGKGAFSRPKAMPSLRETANCVARLHLEQLGPRHCRWPIGNVGEPGFGFCGEVIHFGPYCEPHRALGTTGETLNAKQYARTLRRFA